MLLSRQTVVCAALTFLAALLIHLHPTTALAGDVDVLKARIDGAVMTAPSRAGKGRVAVTLDPDLQREIEQLLKDSRAPAGAIVMSDVKTGRILAWASRGSDVDLVREPRYPGASIFKVVTAAALLEGKHAFRGSPQCFGGGLRRLDLEDVQSLCRPGEPKMKFGLALGHSINVIFGRLALAHLEPKGLQGMADLLGVTGSIPFDADMTPGTVEIPSDDLGLARAAAGFHDGGVTPLSALFMMNTIANKGERVRLQVIGAPEKIRRAESGRALSEATANALGRMLEVTTRSGTSREAFEDRPGRSNVLVAGKTGTLAVSKEKRLVSWFAGFAPARNPEVAISVMLVNDYKWWRKGNQVARDALDTYFRLAASSSS